MFRIHRSLKNTPECAFSLFSDPGRRLSRLRPEIDGAPKHSGRECGVDRYP